MNCIVFRINGCIFKMNFLILDPGIMEKQYKTDIAIINGFALLHALVALGSRLIGIQDDLMLTMLTMLLVVIICLRRGVNAKFMGVCLIAVNIFGFILGMGCAALFRRWTDYTLLVNPLSTFITTEIIGWATYGCTTVVRRRHGFRPSDTTGFKWLLVAIVIILCARLAIILIFSDVLNSDNIVINLIIDYVFSCAVLVFLSANAIHIDETARTDRERTRLAQYSYMKLKQQVNPHFLFNSLNILDCLVKDAPRETASTYIHKLAGMYRYMLRNEDETLVSLRDEMEFVNQYIDMMKLRFPEGLKVEENIPEEALSYSVVPCSVQLLIENATKHNRISPDQPLNIRIFCEGGYIIIDNNLQPKPKSENSSTGLGLKYIHEQYLDLSDRDTVVIPDAADGNGKLHYIVKLPLL